MSRYRNLSGDYRNFPEPSLDEEYYRGPEEPHCEDCGSPTEQDADEDGIFYICTNKNCPEPSDEPLELDED